MEASGHGGSLGSRRLEIRLLPPALEWRRFELRLWCMSPGQMQRQSRMSSVLAQRQVVGKEEAILSARCGGMVDARGRCGG
jgi:hypothetical protein